MTERVKVYEEGGKKAGLPIWAWLIPLLLLLALLAYFLTRHKSDNAAGSVTPAATASAPTGELPTLAAVHFATDKSDLSDEAKATLDQASVAMKQDKKIHLRVEGYTDSSGMVAHNNDLAGARAAAVVDYLRAKGVYQEQLTGEGFGAEKPVDTNATAAGKADNRRVELFRAP